MRGALSASVAEPRSNRNAETNPGVIQRQDLEGRLQARGLAPRWEGNPPPGFAGVVTDSREVQPGVLFCALRGTEFDGHQFVARAAAAPFAETVASRVESTLALRAGRLPLVVDCA